MALISIPDPKRAGHNLLRSDATNAYDLLTDVAKAIREDPLKYDQNRWISRSKETFDQVLGVGVEPACGTIGCRAGWIAQLGTSPEQIDAALARHEDPYGDGDTPFNNSYGIEMKSIAESLLGVTDRDPFFGDLQRLFDTGNLRFGQPEEEWGDDVPLPGTPEYAEAGARGIEYFRDRYEERLRGTRINPVAISPNSGC